MARDLVAGGHRPVAGDGWPTLLRRAAPLDPAGRSRGPPTSEAFCGRTPGRSTLPAGARPVARVTRSAQAGRGRDVSHLAETLSPAFRPENTQSASERPLTYEREATPAAQRPTA